eukprot:388471-Rhodomonas_salina.1
MVTRGGEGDCDWGLVCRGDARGRRGAGRSGKGDGEQDERWWGEGWGRMKWGYRNDLHGYTVASGAWSDLSSPSSGSPPSVRLRHGMAAWEGVVYVFGGYGVS